MFRNENASPNVVRAQPGKPAVQTNGLEYVYLREYFGHDEFRGGQHEVVHAAVQGRDVAVFWATGAGKSLCYQLPALQSGKTVVVVSPLISLMQDQVAKFNATVGACEGNHRACFLGSSQFDRQVEGDALRGMYRLVYVTPEKITGGGFLSQLQSMHAANRLALLAVDEAHCISEWGHDFRPSYRALRSVREELPGLPIMALTATAVSRVRDDIVEQLGMRADRLLSCSTFDRPNLQLACSRKTSKATDLTRIAKGIAEHGGSTIVYAPTQSEVEAVAGFLAQALGQRGITVAAYHGGKAMGVREEAHFDFLSGKKQVIVATVAFGMGIDKPDIRRIVHYGPPKTVEEYFQQIGRAGRDGINSFCELICNDADFMTYSSDFYTKGLTSQGKEQMLASCEALRCYAGQTRCRRGWLLGYFGETPAFGDACGTCDVCTAAAGNANDTHRDFRSAAAPILEAVAVTSSFPQPLSQLWPIINGSYKPNGGSMVRAVTEATPRIQVMRGALPRLMRTEAITKEMIGMLCSAGYIARKRIELQSADRFRNSFDVYEITDLGTRARGGTMEIKLAVPMVIRKHEEEERLKQEARDREYQKAGLDPKRMSRKEREDESNPALWHIRKQQSLRDGGRGALADQNDELIRRVLAWRDSTAQRLRIAPADVMAETVPLSIAYTKPTTVEALRAAGVRVQGMEQLAALIVAAKQELFPASAGDAEGADAASPGGAKRAAPMKIPTGLWTPAKWAGAVYKPGKGGAKPPWEVSYDRFAKGEGIQSIAVKQLKGKPIQTSTVVGHLQVAMQHGKPVDLSRIARECDEPLPDEACWAKLEQTVVELKCNVEDSEFRAKELLAGILGDKVNLDFADKPEELKAQEKVWYSRIRWLEAFKRGRYTPSFGPDDEPAAKRQRQ